MADASAALQGFAQTWQRAQGSKVDPFFANSALELLGGPSIASLAGLPGFSSSAESRATGTQTSTVSVPFVQSSPFILGEGNKTGDVGTGGTTGGTASSAPAAGGISRLGELLGPAATLATLAVALIALFKVIK